MCIRDSANTLARGYSGVRLETLQLLLALLNRNILPLIPETVSYTHLRAHETVLDLVCRLLLEKKNTKIEHYPS